MSANELACFPLESAILPGETVPLQVFEPRYLALVADCLAGARRFATVLITAGSEVGGGERRASIGTLLELVEATAIDEERILLIARGIERVVIDEWLPDDPYPRALASVRDDAADGIDPALLARAEQAVRSARALASELDWCRAALGSAPACGCTALSWWLCAQAPLGPLDRLALLETDPVEERLERLVRACTEVARDCARLLGADGDR